MEADSGTPLTELKIDGGISSNKFVVQFLADLLERKVTNIEIADVSAMGAAYLAGLNAGIYKNIDQLKTFNQDSTSTLAGSDAGKVKGYYKGWKKVIQKK
jgi:glycerol kinase